MRIRFNLQILHTHLLLVKVRVTLILLLLLLRLRCHKSLVALTGRLASVHDSEDSLLLR